MEKSTSHTQTLLTIFVTAVVTCFLTLAGVYLLAPGTAPKVHRPIGMEVRDRLPEMTEKMHRNGVTAIRTVGQNTCLIVVGDKPSSLNQPRALGISQNEINPSAMRDVFGDEIAGFCGGRQIFTASPVVSAPRNKRQAVEISPLRAQKEGLRPSNGCQNQVIVDCGGDGTSTYKCNTGAGEIYRGEVECLAENSFRLSLKPRCNEFKDTNKLRFIKCLVKFTTGQTGDYIGEE